MLDALSDPLFVRLFDVIARSVPLMVGSCAGLAALIGTFDAAGKSITGAYAHGQPIYGAKASEHGVALEGEPGHYAGAGEVGWREERAKRREKFFKVRTPSSLEMIGKCAQIDLSLHLNSQGKVQIQRAASKRGEAPKQHIVNIYITTKFIGFCICTTWMA